MEFLVFEHHQAFYDWLLNHHEEVASVWIRFDKTQKTSTLTSQEALHIALCFGWIDGQIKRIDDQYYVKYFAKRSHRSVWSTQNKKFAEKLISERLMMPSGYKAIELAKKDGRWDQADSPPIDFNLDQFRELLNVSPKAYSQFITFSLSIQKTYAMSYYMLKKNESRERRLNVIIERLEKGLKPM